MSPRCLFKLHINNIDTICALTAQHGGHIITSNITIMAKIISLLDNDVLTAIFHHDPSLMEYDAVQICI
jgi:riboflavin synthase alpha subunit